MHATKTTTTAAVIRRPDTSLARGTLAALLVLTSLMAFDAVSAQGRDNANDNRGRDAQGIPPGHLPRAGECRVWYDGRPPGQQPSPTSCANARASVARSGGRVIYGDDVRGDDRRGASRRDDERYDRTCSDKDRRKGKCEYDRNCSEKDRRKGKCEYDRDDDRRYPNGSADRYPTRAGDRTTDGRYPDNRYPDNRYPDNRNPNGTYPNNGNSRAMPDMLWAVEYNRGNRTNEVSQWVGAEKLRVSYTDSDRNGTPEAATFATFAGRIVQRWNDDNGDGRADRVSVYENNKIVRVIQ